MQRNGKVYLVGAGLGSIDYLTVQGWELLKQAEVLIYDALVDDRLVNLTPTSCLRLDVGKRGGKPSTSQAEINSLLVKYCLEGKQVVRLKSGDPFIFGRAVPEIEALQAARCNWEVIPGITSAIATPLLAGIPLTEKDLSRCFAVVTGHQPDILDWEALAKIDTLVILMGGRSLAEILQRLKDNGRSSDEPIAIIKNCTRPEQRIFRGTLTDIVEKTSSISLSPAVIVIGKVVSLIDRLSQSSPSNLPLTGKTVVITRSAGQSSNFRDLLQQKGANILEMPALEITPPSSWADLDRAIANLASFNWLILTSANGVNYFFDRLETQGKDTRTLAGIKIAVVGKKTAATLKQKNLRSDFIPPDFIADSLVENFPEALSQKKILFPRVETGGREILVKELSAKGAEVVEVAAYQSGCPEKIELNIWQALQQKQIDIITFASSKTVKNFVKLVEKELDNIEGITLRSLLENVTIASIGPQTSKSCQELLGRVDVEAREYTLEGLTQAIAGKFLD
ncbi:MAG: uroporphyrinogen-III C-methyltransferase [Xenococcaceae cyanobacterium]